MNFQETRCLAWDHVKAHGAQSASLKMCVVQEASSQRTNHVHTCVSHMARQQIILSAALYNLTLTRNFSVITSWLKHVWSFSVFIGRPQPWFHFIRTIIWRWNILCITKEADVCSLAWSTALLWAARPIEDVRGVNKISTANTDIWQSQWTTALLRTVWPHYDSLTWTWQIRNT